MIYVHNNPNNIQYNDYMYLFMRLWHLPTTSFLSITEDSWLKVPVLRTDLAGGRKFYTLPNQNLDSASVIKLTSDGYLLKMIQKPKLEETIDPLVFESVKENAINVSFWEEQNQRAWPYDNMFSHAAMKQRRDLKFGTTNHTFDLPVTNVMYTQIASKHKPKPCNCGKKR